jgi:hypothetical protein
MKTAELKLATMHEGWEAESPAGKRFRLVNKAVWAGYLSSQEFWERGAIRFAARYNRDKVGRVVVNGDGAEWIKQAPQYFEGAEVYLDPFHRNKAIREALSFEPGLVERAMKALQNRDLQGLKRVIAEGLRKAPGDEQARRVKELQRYLRANWDGLLDWRGEGNHPAGARGLGASEAEINHVLAVRMTKRGMSWRQKGAHHMALLRCLEVEGRLSEWLETWQKGRWPEVKREDRRHAPSRVIERLSETDPRSSLAAHLPLLATAAGQSELGWRLKQLIRSAAFSELKSRAQPVPFGGNIFAIRQTSA